jgi:hypothetical protein
MVLMLLAEFFSAEAYAQEAIKALIKKCETMETVDINIVLRRNKDTKKVIRSVITLQIKSNPALVKEFQDAFQKVSGNDFSKSQDAPDREIITRRGGKIVNLMYTYGNVSYDFTVEPNGQNARVGVTERNEEEEEKGNGDGGFKIGKILPDIEKGIDWVPQDMFFYIPGRI